MCLLCLLLSRFAKAQLWKFKRILPVAGLQIAHRFSSNAAHCQLQGPVELNAVAGHDVSGLQIAHGLSSNAVQCQLQGPVELNTVAGHDVSGLQIAHGSSRNAAHCQLQGPVELNAVAGHAVPGSPLEAPQPRFAAGLRHPPTASMQSLPAPARSPVSVGTSVSSSRGALMAAPPRSPPTHMQVTCRCHSPIQHGFDRVAMRRLEAHTAYLDVRPQAWFMHWYFDPS